MTEEDLAGAKIDELLELERENNKMLRGMHRRMVWSQVFTVLYWLVILGVAGWSFYYLQPYLEQYMKTYQSIMHSIDSLNEQSKAFPTNLQGILEKVK